MSRLVPPPPVLLPWDSWCRGVDAAVKARGCWAGSYAKVLEWAIGKLEVASARDRTKSAAEGWNTPEGLLARWTRLHRLDWVATGDELLLKSRPTRIPKKHAPIPPPSPPIPF